MADRLLYVRTEFAEGAVIFHDFEERVVAKAVGSRGLEANAARADVFALGANRARRIGDRYMAHVVCGPLGKRSIAEVGQQPSIVVAIFRARARIASGIDAGRSLQRV